MRSLEERGLAASEEFRGECFEGAGNACRKVEVRELPLNAFRSDHPSRRVTRFRGIAETVVVERQVDLCLLIVLERVDEPESREFEIGRRVRMALAVKRDDAALKQAQVELCGRRGQCGRRRGEQQKYGQRQFTDS